MVQGRADGFAKWVDGKGGWMKWGDYFFSMVFVLRRLGVSGAGEGPICLWIKDLRRPGTRGIASGLVEILVRVRVRVSVVLSERLPPFL